MECIILAGGQGTRLQSVVSDVPKCLAPINGKPFLDYIFEYLESQMVDHVVLSLGYKYEDVLHYLKGKAFTCKVSWVIEKQPLGTGGAIKLALQKTKSKHIFVMNGDTYFPVNLRAMASIHTPDTSITIASKKLQNIDRFGLLNVENNIVKTFKEKEFVSEGLINGGTYIINTQLIDFQNYNGTFSFEKEILEQFVTEKVIKSFESDATFLDIGIPEDYAKAQDLLRKQQT